MRLEVMIGSVRAGRIGPRVAEWFVRRAGEHGGFDVDTLDLVDWDLPRDLARTELTARFTERIGAADAIVVVTPEYNHGYPPAVKLAFDSAKFEWRAKPVGFVSYGGMAGGLRAVEQLRLVAAEVHMVSVRETVSFHGVRSAFTPESHDDGGAASDAADRLLTQLHWWASTLAATRESYPGGVRAPGGTPARGGDR